MSDSDLLFLADADSKVKNSHKLIKALRLSQYRRLFPQQETKDN